MTQIETPYGRFTSGELQQGSSSVQFEMSLGASVVDLKDCNLQ
jgi:hypothetical protein